MDILGDSETSQRMCYKGKSYIMEGGCGRDWKGVKYWVPRVYGQDLMDMDGVDLELYGLQTR